MMITIHGFPAKTKYQDVKILIKQECNINDFILDNLITDTDGTKKVRIGLTDNTEGCKVMKCLDGYRMPGNFVLKAVPIGKAVYLRGKARPLSRDEVTLLLNLISKHRIVTSTSMTASHNRTKMDAWKSIAHSFSVATGEVRRAQLRIKWDNLKKNVSKRNMFIKLNKSKSGGRRRYIRPDETVDRVATLLSGSSIGAKVELDDDNESDVPVSEFRDEEVPQLNNDSLASSLIEESPNRRNLTSSFTTGSINSETFSSRFFAGPPNTTTIQTVTYKKPETPLQRIELCVMDNAEESLLENNTPESSEIIELTLAEAEQQSRINKNEALAAYFQAKAEKIQLESEKLKLEIELLKNNTSPNGLNS